MRGQLKIVCSPWTQFAHIGARVRANSLIFLVSSVSSFNCCCCCCCCYSMRSYWLLTVWNMSYIQRRNTSVNIPAYGMVFELSLACSPSLSRSRTHLWWVLYGKCVWVLLLFSAYVCCWLVSAERARKWVEYFITFVVPACVCVSELRRVCIYIGMHNFSVVRSKRNCKQHTAREWVHRAFFGCEWS